MIRFIKLVSVTLWETFRHPFTTTTIYVDRKPPTDFDRGVMLGCWLGLIVGSLATAMVFGAFFVWLTWPKGSLP